MGFLFIVAGLLFYQKHKRANAAVETPANTEPVKPEFASKNAAVESDSIDKAKAEIKKKEEEEQAQIKAVEEAQAQAKAEAKRAEVCRRAGSGRTRR